MNKAKSFVVLGVTLVIASCAARSLYPLFTEKDLVFNPSLVGTWVDKDGRDAYTFQKSGGNSYLVAYHELKKVNSQKESDAPGDSAVYNVQLGQLGKYWYLDSYPAVTIGDHHMIAAHIISRIWFGEDTLRMAPLESDWLKKMIDSNRLDIAHVRLDDDIVLTASSEKLQFLVLKYAETDGAFPNPDTLHRAR